MLCRQVYITDTHPAAAASQPPSTPGWRRWGPKVGALLRGPRGARLPEHRASLMILHFQVTKAEQTEVSKKPFSFAGFSLNCHRENQEDKLGKTHGKSRGTESRDAPSVTGSAGAE